MTNQTSIVITKETRDIVKSNKRGGEDYDDLLRKMAEQYDPDSLEGD